MEKTTTQTDVLEAVVVVVIYNIFFLLYCSATVNSKRMRKGKNERASQWETYKQTNKAKDRRIEYLYECVRGEQVRLQTFFWCFYTTKERLVTNGTDGLFLWSFCNDNALLALHCCNITGCKSAKALNTF